MSKKTDKIYVLITPARNEANYIKKTIESVVTQTLLPMKWIIVNDGSNDKTEEIVNEYTAKYDFIQMIHTQATSIRDFGSKVKAFRLGYEQLQHKEFNFVGILDADITIEPDYYDSILAKFQENPNLGVAGGIVFNVSNGKCFKQLANLKSVGGPIQLFRRKCYEAIGGFIPIKIGGEDVIAENMAKMHGWEVQSFPEIKAYHHRRTGTEGKSIYRAKFIHGHEDYLLGNHPIFELTKCLYRIIERPYLISGFLRLCGYCWLWIRGAKKEAPDDFIRYIRHDQIRRLRSKFIVKKINREGKRIIDRCTM